MAIDHRGAVKGDADFRLRDGRRPHRVLLGGAAPVPVVARWAGRRAGRPPVLHRVWSGNVERLKAMIEAPVSTGGRRGALVALVATLLGTVGVHTAASAATARRRSPIPRRRRRCPLTGGDGEIVMRGTTFDLASVGYTATEWLVSGWASSYTSAKPLQPSGRWTVRRDSVAPYTTRIVVYRPVEPERFSGTTAVEWLNVSAGIDHAPTWVLTHTALLARGDAWVGVSAQVAGIEGFGSTVGGIAATAVEDPERYAGLHLPSDSFSYDVFSQVGRLVRASRTGERARRAQHDVAARDRAVAVGDAAHDVPRRAAAARRGLRRLLRAQPRRNRRPALAVAAARRRRRRHRRASGPISTCRCSCSPRRATCSTWAPSHRRSPTATTTATGRSRARRTSTRTASASGVPTPATDAPTSSCSTRCCTRPLRSPVTSRECDDPINAGPHHYVAAAAYTALARWVGRRDAAAARATDPDPRRRSATSPATSTATRSAASARRRSTHRSRRCPASASATAAARSTARRRRSTRPPSQRSYPSHGAFVEAWDAATDRAVADGFLLPADAAHLRAAAEQSTVGR